MTREQQLLAIASQALARGEVGKALWIQSQVQELAVEWARTHEIPAYVL